MVASLTPAAGACANDGARGHKARGRLQELGHALNSSADPQGIPGAHAMVGRPAAAACPPWTRRPMGLCGPQMGPARAAGWASADLGRAFGLGPVR
jgi:hypothetical protein